MRTYNRRNSFQINIKKDTFQRIFHGLNFEQILQILHNWIAYNNFSMFNIIKSERICPFMDDYEGIGHICILQTCYQFVYCWKRLFDFLFYPVSLLYPWCIMCPFPSVFSWKKTFPRHFLLLEFIRIRNIKWVYA